MLLGVLHVAADIEQGLPEPELLLEFGPPALVEAVEEEELSALMGEKEDYNNADEQNEEQWED